MTYSSFEVGTAAFREKVSDPKLRRLLSEHPVVEVGRYAGAPAAVVVDPQVFAEMAEDHERLQELRSMIPLLVAALSSGAAIPSETLARLGVALPDDSWQTLNELQSRFAPIIGYGEDGVRLSRVALTTTGPVVDLDEELVTSDD